MSERMFPLQPSRNQNRNPLPGPLLIPWSVAEKAYGAYAAEFGRGQSLQRLAERGGFGVSEMDSLYPQWREEVDEITRLRKLLADYEDCKDAIEVLRDVGRAIGCGHTEDADGRSQIPRCIRETVERLENEIHALKTADMSGSGI